VSDEAKWLIGRARAGDPTALAVLYRRYQHKVYREATTEDLTSGVFVRFVLSASRRFTIADVRCL